MSNESLKLNENPQLEVVDFSREKVREPLNAHRIREGEYGVAKYSPERPYLLTYGLSDCNAVFFYRSDEQKGLAAHVSAIRSLERSLEKLIENFGSLADADVYVLSGGAKAGGDRKFRLDPKRYWPSIQELIDEILKHKPTRLVVSATEGTSPTGFVLDLGNGELKEIDGSGGWTWSSNQDTSISKKLEEEA